MTRSPTAIQSSSVSGYRCDLQNLLSGDGDSYQFVGSQISGSGCSQEQNEGHPGWTIAGLAYIQACTIDKSQPNVVLLDIGTNDLTYRGGTVPAAMTGIENLVENIFGGDPGVTVLVGSLIPTTNSTVEAAKMSQFNNWVHAWVNDQQSAGQHVGWADMGAVTAADLADGLHPNDTGYQLMADSWNMAIDSAIAAGWINAPNASPIRISCNPSGGPVWHPQGTIAAGVGAPGGEIRFADINGDGRADYLVVNPNGTVDAWLNGGPNSAAQDGWLWYPQGEIAAGVGAPGSEIRFADINGDGRADYLVVNPNGTVDAWLNGGPDPAAQDGWLWYPLGEIAAGVGAPGSEVRFADINGDGRADYLVVNPNGSVDTWLNGDQDPRAQDGWLWYPAGEIAAGVGTSGSQIHFADINGDTQADYLNVNPDSSVQEWLNGGANSAAQDGWLWTPVGEIAAGVGAPGSQIQFADLTGGGLADYLNVNPDGSVQAWLNGGLDPSSSRS